MAGRDIVVIGASAGGLEALIRIVRELPANLPAAVFVTVHTAQHTPSVLDQILKRAGAMASVHAADGMPIEQGTIYVAPPRRHLLLTPGVVRLSDGPKENGYRPAIDPMFRSAATAYGPQVIGMVLSGALDDGSAGLAVIKDAGGMTVVQDPEDALISSMPLRAIQNVQVDAVLPSAKIGAFLVKATRAGFPLPQPEAALMDNEMEKEPYAVPMERALFPETKMDGKPSNYTCPDCGGVLWEQEKNGILQFRCRVDHVYSVESMLESQADAVEAALWAALQALEQKAELRKRLGQRARERGSALLATKYEAEADETWQRVELLRQALLNRNTAVRKSFGKTANGRKRLAPAGE